MRSIAKGYEISYTESTTKVADSKMTNLSSYLIVGNFRVMVLVPAWCSKLADPPCNSTIAFTIANPSPVPSVVRALSRAKNG